MAVAAAAATATATMPPSPPAVALRTVAWLVCTRLAWAAADAVICLVIASMWLVFWGLATTVIGRLACGKDCAVVTAAYEVIPVALGVTLVLLLPFAGLLTAALMMARAQATAATTATDTEAKKEKSSYAAVRNILCDSLTLGLLASWAFALLMPFGELVMGESPVMGSRRERMGSVIYNVGALGNVMVNCFVSCPIMTVRIWRPWRMARDWRKARHAL